MLIEKTQPNRCDRRASTRFHFFGRLLNQKSLKCVLARNRFWKNFLTLLTLMTNRSAKQPSHPSCISPNRATLLQCALAKRLLGKRNQDVAKWITEQQQGIVSYGNSRLDRPIVDVQLDRTRGIDPGFYSDSLRDSDFARIGTLRELRSLTLEYRTTFSDDALKHLKDLKKLETLNLSRTSLTGSGLRHIAGLPNLRTLNLNGCPRINDDEMKSLSRATSLKKISLEGNLWFLAIG